MKKLFHKSTLQKETGFFSVHFVLFFLLMTSFVLVQGYLLHAGSLKDKFRQTCLTEAVDIERTLIQMEKRLFKLNTVSTALRLQIAALKVGIIAAVATYNAPLVARLTQQLHNAYKQQDLLDSAQKALIRFANLQAQAQYLRLFAKTNQNLFQQTSAWSEFLLSFSLMRPSKLPRLSVKPDSIGGKGPNYELENNYKTIQRVELFWNSHLINIKTALLASSKVIRYSMRCQIEAQKKDDTWVLEISLDKH